MKVVSVFLPFHSIPCGFFFLLALIHLCLIASTAAIAATENLSWGERTNEPHTLSEAVAFRSRRRKDDVLVPE